MKKLNIYLITIFLLQLSCQQSSQTNIWLEGDLFAKNLITVKYDLSKPLGEPVYAWFTADSQEGEWEELPGILTEDIVLLTSYVDRFVKCEITWSDHESNEQIVANVISKKPVIYRGNPNTDWFRDAGFGIMVHYLKPAIVPDGGAKEWNEAVDAFDVEKFAIQASEAGVGFVMFTLGQNSGYYCSPNAAFNHIMEINPGELCSNRDLPMDLMNELEKYNISLILYLPSNPPVNNELVSEKFRYPYKNDSATSQYNQPILEDMVREWSLRYGTRVKGWWFDGLYSWNAIRSTRMDMSLKHNISTHTLAAKSGNKNSIVTYNYGFGEIQVNTPYCDYSSGEKRTIDEFPNSRWVEDGVQWFLFTYLGEKWGGKGHQFDTEALVDMAARIVENEGVLCLEVVTNAKGQILPHHFEQIRALGKKLGKAH